MFNYKQVFVGMLILGMSAGTLAAGSGLSAEQLKMKPADKIIAKEPARPSLKGALPSQQLGLASRPQAAASQSSSQKENLNKAAYLKNIMKPGKPTLGGEGGSQSGGNPPQGCLNCNN